MMAKALRCSWLLLCLAATGCVSSKLLDYDFSRPVVFAPLPPSFLAGPVAVTLTNLGGFSARLSATGMDFTATDNQPLTGQLLGRGSWLLFAPDPKENKDDKDAIQPGFSFLWDVSANRGYLLSEALQAYAPVSSFLRYTDVAIDKNAGPGLPATDLLTATVPDGTFSARITRNPDGLPTRIISGTNDLTASLALTRIRRVPPPAELFSIPTGFTAYQSPEALVDELAARSRGYRKPEETTPREPLMPSLNEPYVR